MHVTTKGKEKKKEENGPIRPFNGEKKRRNASLGLQPQRDTFWEMIKEM